MLPQAQRAGHGWPEAADGMGEGGHTDARQELRRVRGAADALTRLYKECPETGLPEQRRRNQPVVAAPDDDGVPGALSPHAPTSLTRRAPAARRTLAAPPRARGHALAAPPVPRGGRERP